MEHDLLTACVIAQQNSSAAFSLHWESARFKNPFFIFLFLFSYFEKNRKSEIALLETA